MDCLFDLDDLYVHQVMTPRVRIDAIPEGADHEQIREIVRRTARRHHLPIRDELLVRTRNTSPQTILTRKARLANLDQTFEAPPDVRGLRILLADDTATTGTSLRKGSDALLRAGAVRVDVAVIARTGVHGAN